MSAIKRIRIMRGINQKELADAIGVSPAAISHWENGRRKPDVDDLIAIARFFGCKVDDLIDK